MIRQVPPGSLVVRPNPVSGHLSTAKAWVQFTATGGVAKAYNVSTATGINRTALGEFTIYFSTYFSATGAMVAVANAQGPSAVILITIATTASNAVSLRTIDTNLGALSETGISFINLACFG